MRARDFDALGSTTYDVLVVGGGIHGLATALDAAARGLSVALVEAGDFAAATSFNHQRTAHGGLRSLQSGRLGYARESIRERRALARIAPRLLRPLPFMIGTYQSLVKNRLALRIGFRVDRWLGRHRNDGLEPELHLPPAKLISRAATLKLFAGVRQEGLTGGANWYDYQIVQSSRLAIAFAEGADARGARLVNYAEAIAAVREDGRVAGMRVRDLLSGAELDARARITINCAGPAVNQVMRLFGATAQDVPLVKAMNLVTSKPASDIALAAPPFAKATGDKPATGRMLTLTPWQGRALIGTWHSDDFKQPSDVTPTTAEIDAFIADANSAFPALKMSRSDVTLVHRGVVPARKGTHGRAELLGTPQLIDHAGHGASGAMTVIGVKYTTARAVGAKAARMAAKVLRKHTRDTDTDRAILPGAGIADHEALTIETARAVGLELAPPIIRHITNTYGDRCAAIVRLMAEKSDWRMPLVAGRPNVGAEVIHAIRAEMACTLADIVIRRTELGAMAHPGTEMVTAAAAIAAEEWQWDADRRNREIAAIDDFYKLPDFQISRST
ncbi:MAG TPA: FAD-dependent oxidoreductase [Vicinamibacterales bacterium]|nr:FAD-dependent oxidoreductase [Vicinamibacterales bacterium]